MKEKPTEERSCMNLYGHGITGDAEGSKAETAAQALSQGFQAMPLKSRDKRPGVSGWTRLKWSNTDEGRELQQTKFDEWAKSGSANIGLVLGEPSANLIDVDLDHPKAVRLKDHFLPPTPMRSGRAGRPNSHFWYLAEAGTLPGTRIYKMPDNETVTVELRSTGAQTAIPPSVHPSGEPYLWGGERFGGERGPLEINGQILSVQVAVLALASVLVEFWPGQGSRHQAYLALAGGLLRAGDGVHPYWETNAPSLIGALADATDDEDGPEQRISEVMESTLTRLRSGKPVAGFGKLAQILGRDKKGNDVVKHVRVLVGDVESAAGVPSRSSGLLGVEEVAEIIEARKGAESEYDEGEEPERIDPLEGRSGTWEPIDLDPYLTSQVEQIMPTVLERTDGASLIYDGRVNMLYGPSEAAKSWIAMYTSIQAINHGQRVIYVDLEDEPMNSMNRFRLLGAGIDDLRHGLTYVRPEDPIASMQRTKWGEHKPTEDGEINETLFEQALKLIDPSLIVIDGMSELYGLHGLDTNDTSHTTVIARWLKQITRQHRTTVLVLDHAPKDPQRGALPIGSQHKVSMVQGTLLQAYPISQPYPGGVGEIELIILKDRPGQVRAVGEKTGDKAQLVANVFIDSRIEGQTHLSIKPPQSVTPAGSGDKAREQQLDLRRSKEAEKAERARRAEERVKHLYGGELDKGLSLMEICQLIYGTDNPSDANKRQQRAVVKRLIDQGWLEPRGPRKSMTYHLQIGESGYEDLDDGGEVIEVDFDTSD